MNQLVNMPVLTMSSREIAEVTEASHDNVLKTIRALVAKGIVFGNETPYQHAQNGQTYQEFKLSYRDTMVVVSGYNAKLRAKIIDRWQELEAMQVQSAPSTIAIPQSFAEALRLAADQAEQIEQQAQQLAIAAPKVEFVDQYVDASGSMTFRQVAKLLGVKENMFSAFLLENSIMYRLAGNLTAYQKHIDAGRFEVKTGKAKHNDHAFAASRFLPKGVEYVSRLLRDSKREPEKGLSLLVQS